MVSSPAPAEAAVDLNLSVNLNDSDSNSVSDSGVTRRSNLLSLLLCWCEDSLFDVLCRLSQRDLVKCKMVSKSWQWHRIISRVWLRMFWPRSPTVGLFYRTIHSCGMYQLLSLVYLYDYPFFKSPESSSPLVDWDGELCRWQRRDFSDNLRDFEAEEADFCAALAYDPVESDHYRVVRIDYFHSQQQPTSIITTTPMDIFSSHSRQWFDMGCDLTPFLLRASKARAFQLPPCPVHEEKDHDDDHKTMMGCLGDVNLVIDGLSDIVCGMTLRMKVLFASDVKYNQHHDTLVPFAISPNSHVLFFGTRRLIFRYDLKSRRKLKLLHKTQLNIAVSGYHFPFFTLRACLMPFYGLDHAQKSVGSPFPAAQEVSKGAKILSEEIACQCDTEKDSWIEHVDSYFVHKDRRPFFILAKCSYVRGWRRWNYPSHNNRFVASFSRLNYHRQCKRPESAST
ncbi:hypothetical protein C1H46_015308 [Malus baccata]|uniref:F-box domain-containing protein n=1 Tax=Malus baccata TaxID=106549 RepID=A0A540MJT7_MALBA|nr:hypothetical protein C1H46_015308 [Malus baccata]